jgi:hypothetical protein
MKTYGRKEVYLHTRLTSALKGRNMSASSPSRFTPGSINPGTHSTGDWVGTSIGLDAVLDIKKNLLHLPEVDLKVLGRNPVTSSLWVKTVIN